MSKLNIVVSFFKYKLCVVAVLMLERSYQFALYLLRCSSKPLIFYIPFYSSDFLKCALTAFCKVSIHVRYAAIEYI